jgi:hypothetical protein
MPGTPVRRSTKWWAAATITGTAAAALVACSAGSGSAGAPATASPPVTASPSPSPPRDPRAAAEQQALAAYTGMWEAMTVAAQTSDAEDPALRRYATGDALALLTGSLRGDRRRGLVSKGRPVLAPRLTSLTPAETPTAAAVSDCVDTTRWLKYRLDGSLQDDAPGGRRRIISDLTATANGWVVTRVVVNEVGTC